MKNRVLMTILLAAAPFLATAQSFQGKPFLAVQGHAEAKVKPDIFPIAVTLTDTSMDSAKSQTLVEGLAKQVLAVAQALKVGDLDLEIGNLSISPNSDWDEKKDEDVFKGNTYEREITIRFHNLADLKSFIGQMPESRAIKLDTKTFEYSGAAELKRKLRREAIDDARQAGLEMADAVHKRLLNLFNVSDRAQSVVYASSGYSNSDALRYSAEDARRQGGTAVNAIDVVSVKRGSEIVLREGEIKISADAYLVYEIGD
jgi:uncharacterized protein YggE